LTSTAAEDGGMQRASRRAGVHPCAEWAERPVMADKVGAALATAFQAPGPVVLVGRTWSW